MPLRVVLKKMTATRIWKKHPNNFFLQYLKEKRSFIEEYNGRCDTLAKRVTQWLKRRRVPITGRMFLERADDQWLEPSTYPDKGWFYHVVIKDTKNLIHDAWFGEPIPESDYLTNMFPNQKVKVDAFKSLYSKHTNPKSKRDPNDPNDSNDPVADAIRS